MFAPKYRRQVIYGKIKADIGQILRKLCAVIDGFVRKGRHIKNRPKLFKMLAVCAERELQFIYHDFRSACYSDALENTNLCSFINSLEEADDIILFEDGNNISGGQALSKKIEEAMQRHKFMIHYGI